MQTSKERIELVKFRFIEIFDKYSLFPTSIITTVWIFQNREGAFFLNVTRLLSIFLLTQELLKYETNRAIRDILTLQVIVRIIRLLLSPT